MTVPQRRAPGAQAPTPAATAGRDPFAAPGAATSGPGVFRIDLTNVQTGPSFQMEVGVHPAKLVDVQFGVSGAGNQKIVWTFLVLGGPCRGKQPNFHTALTERAMWKVGQTTDALGLGGGGQVLSFTRDQAIGRVCALVVTDQEYNGTMRPAIESVDFWDNWADEPIFQETSERLGLGVEAPAAGVPSF